jgi:predicted GH43/DUF377 family glycosyl hydrolase
MKRRVILIVVVVALVLVACESLLGAAVVRGHHEVAARRIELERTRNQLGDTETALAHTDSPLSHANKSSGDRVAEQQRAKAALATARQALAAVNRDLDSAKAQSAQTEQALVDIQACLKATSDATAAKRTNHARAIDILRDAQPRCELRLADGDPNPPVFPFDFADPSVLRVGNTFYAYSTNGALGNMQVLSSKDLLHWTIEGDAMPLLPVWASPNGTWAPAVERIGDRYVAYYTARETSTLLECIGAGVSSSPTGPFIDASKTPLICQREQGGSIDPRPFVDVFGRATLLWKNEAGAGLPTQIWSQALTPDGLKTTGSATVLIKPDRDWEHGVVEAPALVSYNGSLVLFYSGARWTTDGYALGAARCDTPAGPCRKVPEPVLRSFGSIAGPGGADFVEPGDGSLWMLYSAFRSPHVGYPSSRLLRRAKVELTLDHVGFSAS